MPLGPGKYPFNTYAGSIILVPTTNFVLHWVTGRTETHRYDESLRSIDLVTKDAYEPLLPLSVVVHIDYQKAPSVIQRFGDVKKLITQTLDPMLSAYFRDVAHKKTMLATAAGARRHPARGPRGAAPPVPRVRHRVRRRADRQARHGRSRRRGKIETLLEQFRLRQLSIEQIETFERQVSAAEKLRSLNEAQAVAAMQTQLTNSLVQVQIAENEGEAALARARKQAEQLVVTAQAESQQRVLAGRGEGSRMLAGRSFRGVGLAPQDPVVLRPAALRAFARSPNSFRRAASRWFPSASSWPGRRQSDRRRLDLVRQRGSRLARPAHQPVVAEKSGFNLADAGPSSGFQEFSDKMAKQALDAMQTALDTSTPAAPTGPTSAPAETAGNGVAVSKT